MPRSSARRRHHRNRGFTIVEVLAALLIVALVTGVLVFEVMRGGWRGMNFSGSEVRALAIARSELAKVGVEWPLTDGARARVVEARFNLAVEARPRPEPDGRAPLTYDVSVIVKWTEPPDNITRAVRLDTVKLAAAVP
ncbi:MAG: prepilin-type N-terminal cleavage/methylation domain-containing protein [Hyphomicrobiaceae bacterium]|nr:prepilin-type N-terminal cleavage/methylation domain-containing protein [Hyphomicrobiaceae bacterium]